MTDGSIAVNIAHALSSTRPAWRLGALLALLAAALVFYPPPQILANSPSLTTTVNTDRSVDLTLSNGPSNWWFKIENWGTCTAASGTTFNNIRGYKTGTYNVWAYSDSSCSAQIAASSFTITNTSLSTTVNNDRSVDLTLSNYSGSNWWFRIEHWGSCTAVSGTTFSNIRGYRTGTYEVVAFTDSNCSFHLATSAFTIPSASLTATVNSDRSVDLTLSGGPGNWWFKIAGYGTCTAASGTSFDNIRGYAPGSYPVWAYSDSACVFDFASASFTIPPLAAAPASVVGYRGWQLIDVEWSAVTGATGYDVKYWHAWYGWKRSHSNISGGTETTKKARITLPANSNVGNYHVAVRAIDANGPGQWAESAAIPSITIVPKATNVTAARASNDETTINVSWSICNVQASWCNGGTPVTGQLVNISDDGGATWERVKTLTSYTSGSTVAISSGDVTGGISGAKSYLVDVGIETRFKTMWTRSNSVPALYLSVSNMSETSDGIGVTILATNIEANGFTTGDHSGGYTLDRVVIKFRASVGAPGTFTAAIHAESGDNPAEDATHTLSGDTTPTSAGDYTYTCSGTCSLSKETTYFLVLSGTSTAHSTGYYKWDTTVSAGETNTPSNAGWSIANRAKRDTGNGWENESQIFSGMFEVIATENRTLSASSVTTSGATLTIGYHSGDWWYKADTGPHTTCSSSAVTGATKTLTGLSPIETYTYSAYSDSTCATLLATAAAFTTGGVSVSNMSETSDGIGVTILATNIEANGFTTGDHSGGYTLDRVVIKFRASVGAPGTFTAAIHAESGDNPAEDATHTLSGDTTPTSAGDYTYTCSGTCSLSKETTYFLVLSGTSTAHSTGYYKWDTTVSAGETNTPSNAGWSIANRAKRDTGNGWENESQIFSGMFEVIATEK